MELRVEHGGVVAHELVPPPTLGNRVHLLVAGIHLGPKLVDLVVDVLDGLLQLPGAHRSLLLHEGVTQLLGETTGFRQLGLDLGFLVDNGEQADDLQTVFLENLVRRPSAAKPMGVRGTPGRPSRQAAAQNETSLDHVNTSVSGVLSAGGRAGCLGRAGSSCLLGGAGDAGSTGPPRLFFLSRSPLNPVTM